VIRKYWFIFGMLLAIILGFIFNDTGKKLYLASNYFAFLSIFFTGINLDFNKISFKRKMCLSIALSNSITLIFAPITFFLIAYYVFSLTGGLLIGVIVLSILPTTIISHIVLCEMAGGNSLLSIINTVISNILSLITIPVFLYIFIEKESHLSIFQLVSRTFMILILPILLSQIVKRVLITKISRHYKVFPIFSQIIVLIFIFISFSINKNLIVSSLSFNSELIKIPIIAFLLHVILLIIAYLGGKVFYIPSAERISILFSSSQKTLPLGMALMLSIFPNATQGTMVIAFYHLIQLFFDSFLAHRIKNRL